VRTLKRYVRCFFLRGLSTQNGWRICGHIVNELCASFRREEVVNMRLLLFSCCAFTCCASILQGQSFTSTGSMHETRAFHTATLLDNGTVLVTGGFSNTAEIYNPLTGTWRYTNYPMNAVRALHSAVKLSNGKVLIIGGMGLPAGVLVESAEIFDPVSESFALVKSPNVSHVGENALLLNDGRVIVTGSVPYCGTTSNISEIYDPVSDTWNETPTMSVGPDPRAVKLPDGSVLAGGGGSCPPSPNVSRYNPTTNTVSQMGPMLTPRLEHTATLLGNGKVLIAAGSDPSFVTNSTEIYDPRAPPSGQSQYGNMLVDARRSHTATLLANGDVLVVGGYQSGNGYGYVGTLASSEQFNHVTLAWSQPGLMSVTRAFHTATLLPSGAVLVVGGLADSSSYSTQLNSAELWTPPVAYSNVLVFPVKTDSHCSGTHNMCTPNTVNISSVFDHKMTKAYESSKDPKSHCAPLSSPPPTWGKIIDFLGEEAQSPPPGSGSFGACGDLHGYTTTQGTKFLSGYHLLGPTYLYYDGHPGFDYPFNFGTAVYPAISGCVSYSIPVAGASPRPFHVLTIVPMTTPPPPGGCLAEKSETGYVIVYMHLSSYLSSDNTTVLHCTVRPSNGAAMCPSTNEVPCSAAMGCAQQDDFVSSTQANPIAFVGNFANGYWGGKKGTIGPHLHFEVDLWPNASPIPIDPYGWKSSTADPYSPLPGIMNTWLWQAAQP
jgi:murein DD-endopeptidase MepM/ murein hydrolase activator NlpD